MPETGFRPAFERDPNERPQRPTRRDFLNLAAKGLVALGAMSEVGDRARVVDLEDEEAESASLEAEEPNVKELPELPPKPKAYPVSKHLQGRNMVDLYTMYTGRTGPMPEVWRVDFDKRLEIMWQIKNRRSGNNRTVVNAGRRLRWNYREKDHAQISLKEYRQEADQVVKEVFTKLNWQKYASIKKLRPEELSKLKSIISNITGEHLLAYCLTELMPGKDGHLNTEVLSFLLKSAGRRYLESIPAVYDPKTSFGPYQFTEYALFDGYVKDKQGHKTRERRGASIVNQCLPDNLKIPGSVAKLRGNDHHKAAFLFTIDNIANLLHKISWNEFRVLSNKAKEADIMAYVATAHHGPAKAKSYARAWLAGGARRPYKDYCTNKIYRLYAEKTQNNLNALKDGERI